MYQQQILLPLKNKISSSSVIANPIKAGELIDAIGANVKTDLSLGDMETVYPITKGISSSNIRNITLNNVGGQDLLASYTADDGEEALITALGIDDFSALQAAISQVLTPTSSSTST